MMSCKDVALLSSRYLDHDLSLAERLGVRLHLLVCRACRRLLGGMRSLMRASALLRTPDAAGRYENLAARLTERLGTSEEGKERR